MAFVDQPTVAGDTVDLTIHAKKDGVVWDITGATVTLYLISPGGTATAKSATVSDGPGGVAHYTTATTDLSEAGDWKVQWKVVAGAVTMWSDQIDLEVEPAAA
jgi:uncharacterized protein YfaS (alpha-2-macroglobulin family)